MIKRTIVTLAALAAVAAGALVASTGTAEAARTRNYEPPTVCRQIGHYVLCYSTNMPSRAKKAPPARRAL